MQRSRTAPTQPDSSCVGSPGAQRRLSRLSRLGLAVIALAFVTTGCGATASDPPDTSDGDTSIMRDDRIVVVGLEDGDVLSGTARIEVELVDIDDPRGVEFYIDEERFDAALTQPWIGNLDTRQFDDGGHVLRVVVPRFGGSTVETGLPIRIDNNGPEVTLLAPAVDGGEAFSSPDMTLLFQITDPSGVAALSVTVNGIPLTVTGPPWQASFGLETLGLTDDDLPLDVVVTTDAIDGAGLSAQHSFEFTLRSRIAWTHSTLDEVWDGPVVTNDGTAIFGSLDGFVYAVDRNGNELWSYDTGAQIATSPDLLGDGSVVVSSGQDVVAVSPGGGGETWRWQGEAPIGSAPTVGAGAVYVGTYENALLALDASNGNELWRAPTGDRILSRPLVTAFGDIVFGSHDGMVYGVDANGNQQWTYQTGDQVWSGPVNTADGDILVGSHDGYLYRLNRYGTLRWEFEARGQIWGSAAEGPDGSIYVASTFRRLYSLSGDGSQEWAEQLSDFSSATPAIARDGTVYIATTPGIVYAYASDGTRQWSFDLGGPMNSNVNGSVVLSPDETMLFVGVTDRRMVALHTGRAGCAAPEMIDVGGTLIMRYEASRVDATRNTQGTSEETICSRAGVQPWTDISWQEAQSACGKLGLTLCPGTIWETACQGPDGADFPYGETYDANACVGDEHPLGGCDTGMCGALATGEALMCVSAAGLFDMSGNVREWTADSQGGGYLVRGGSYQDTRDGLRCSNVYPDTHVLLASERHPDVGFRCCSTP